jgi:putative spermidine/putrescine transport system ATP-binding protein
MQRGNLKLVSLGQRFGSFVALSEVCLDVQAGQFVTLLGPSGSGKTTTLKIIAGFLVPDQGAVILDSRDLTRVPPYKRDIGMVFQNYALFPHMTVAENIGFPLQMRHVARAETQRKVMEALDIVRLPGLGSRHPRMLSGGQQQRVALARALVFRPRLLLMDEPLGALDRKLREAMQLEIVRISREVGITVIYVTHDQEEALAMSDRIAVYNAGRIEQFGSPREVYQRPQTLFVAGFIGESLQVAGVLEIDGGRTFLRTSQLLLPVEMSACQRVGLRHRDNAVLVLRPESIRIEPIRSGPALLNHGAPRLRGRLSDTIYLGSSEKHLITLEDGTTAILRSSLDGTITALPPGTEIEISWREPDGIILPQSEGRQGRSADEHCSMNYSVEDTIAIKREAIQ